MIDAIARWLGLPQREPIAQQLPLLPRPTCALLTGAAGQVARLVLPAVCDAAQAWRLVDRVAIPDDGAFPDRHLRTLGTAGGAQDLLEGVDVVLHFAGQAKPASHDVLHRENVEVVDWLLQEMDRAGVRRLVYASSMHVMGGYSRRDRVLPTHPPRPSSPYGESKLHAEQRIAAAVRRGALEALVLRMGHVTDRIDVAEPANWLAADDLARLVCIGMRHPRITLTTVHAVTPHAGDDLGQREFARRFGMEWRRDAPSYTKALQRLRAWYGDDLVAQRFRGGVFMSGRA